MAYSLKLLFIVLVGLPTGILSLCLSPFDREGRLAYQFGRFWTWAVLRIGRIHVKVEGLEHLGTESQFIFIANHQSYIDIPALIHALPGFQLRWIAKRELLRFPLLGWVIWSSKHVIVDRRNQSGAMGSLRKATERIRAGMSLVIFPEGTRSRGGALLPFKRGGFVLAVKTGTAVVPVTINGSGAILPRDDWRLRRGEVEVVVGEPIPVDRDDSRSVGLLLNRVHEIVQSRVRAAARPLPRES